jgi:hypothetical protein
MKNIDLRFKFSSQITAIKEIRNQWAQWTQNYWEKWIKREEKFGLEFQWYRGYTKEMNFKNIKFWEV